MNTKSTWSTSWFRRRFGDFLEKYEAHEQALVRHPTKSLFFDNDGGKENCTNYNAGDRKSKIVGLYFVPVTSLHGSIKYMNEDITDDLKEFYAKANDHLEENRRFEVVQICYPQKAPCQGDAFFVEGLKKECENRYMDVPWFALPVDRVEKAIRLRNYYGIRDGEFALVLVDASCGKLITKQGYDRLLEDRTASSFPWTRQDVLQILKNIPRFVSNPQTDFKDQSTDSRVTSFQDIDRDAVIGLYFSAHWCPPCKAFTSQLVETYKAIKEAGRKFEIVLVSSDRSSDSYAHYVSKMPWLAIPYEDNDSRAQLTSLFGIQGIPSLILLNPDGSVITEDGRGEVNEDPRGLNFPWYQKSVDILTPRLTAKLQKNPAIVLFTDSEEDVEIELATAVLTPVSEYVRKKYDDELLFFIAIDSDNSDSLREYLQLDDVSPLVTLIDIPLARYTIMEYGEEITEKAIINLINQFYSNELKFLPIN